MSDSSPPPADLQEALALGRDRRARRSRLHAVVASVAVVVLVAFFIAFPDVEPAAEALVFLACNGVLVGARWFTNREDDRERHRTLVAFAVAFVVQTGVLVVELVMQLAGEHTASAPRAVQLGAFAMLLFLALGDRGGESSEEAQ